MNRIFWHTTKQEVSPDGIPQWAIKVTAVGAVAAITIICIAARKLGTRVAVVFTTFKVPSPLYEKISTHITMIDFLLSKILNFSSTTGFDAYSSYWSLFLESCNLLVESNPILSESRCLLNQARVLQRTPWHCIQVFLPLMDGIKPTMLAVKLANRIKTFPV